MFSSLAYAIILMGCSDDMSICEEKARDTRVFATLKQCEGAEAATLMSDVALKIDYPVVATKCTVRSYQFTQTTAPTIGG